MARITRTEQRGTARARHSASGRAAAVLGAPDGLQSETPTVRREPDGGVSQGTAHTLARGAGLRPSLPHPAPQAGSDSGGTSHPGRPGSMALSEARRRGRGGHRSFVEDRQRSSPSSTARPGTVRTNGATLIASGRFTIPTPSGAHAGNGARWVPRRNAAPRRGPRSCLRARAAVWIRAGELMPGRCCRSFHAWVDREVVDLEVVIAVPGCEVRELHDVPALNRPREHVHGRGERPIRFAR